MRFTDTELSQFQCLWREEFSEDISIEQARQRALEVIELFRYLGQLMNEQSSESHNDHEVH
jgi:hypothetical protein